MLAITDFAPLQGRADIDCQISIQSANLPIFNLSIVVQKTLPCFIGPTPKFSAIVWPRSANVAARAQVDPSFHHRPGDQQRHVLARMVGARCCRIVSVIRGNHHQVVVDAGAAADPSAARRTARGWRHSPGRRSDGRTACRSRRGWRRSIRAASTPSPTHTASTPSSSLFVWMARVMPRPANRSSILPMATTGTCAAVRRSSTVSAVGVIAKSRRLVVRVNCPGSPTNGRAMTRPKTIALPPPDRTRCC